MSKIIFSLLIVLTFPAMALAHGDEHGELIIRITNDGFAPKELTVMEGDEVVFINNDDVPHWPASNFHPTHTLYPEFDPLKGIAPGASWKFKFEKVGTWRMHDHLFPHLTGTIIVLEAPETTTENHDAELPSVAPSGFWSKLKELFLSAWHKLAPEKSAAVSSFPKVNNELLAEFKNESEQAKYAWLEKRAELENPKIAWQYVKAAYNTPEGVVGSPHDMAHLMGQLIYKAYGLDGLSICDASFAYGCYHGLMEVAFDKYKDTGSEEDYRQGLVTADQGCQKVAPDTSPSYWSCVHGMGHGIITFREHDLTKGLSDCDFLRDKIRTYCHDGVFMELSISAPKSFYKNDDPIYPCDAVGESYKLACARSQVQVMRTRLSMDTAAIASACESTKEDKIIFNCVDALGYFIAQGSPMDPVRIVSECGQIEGEAAAAQCSAAAAGELVFQNSAGWQKTTQKLCQSLIEEYRALCHARVEQVRVSYGRN